MLSYRAGASAPAPYRTATAAGWRSLSPIRAPPAAGPSGLRARGCAHRRSSPGKQLRTVGTIAHLPADRPQLLAQPVSLGPVPSGARALAGVAQCHHLVGRLGDVRLEQVL